MNPAPSFQQAMAAFNTGDHETAFGLCEDLVSQAPHHADGHHMMALLCEKKGLVRRAESHFRKSLKSQPSQPVVHSNLGNLLQQSRRFVEADRNYERAVSLMPGLVDAWYNRGRMALNLGRVETAIGHLERARSIKSNLNIELLLINAYRESGKPEKAQEIASTLRKRYAHDIRALRAEASVMRDRDPAMARRFLENRLADTDKPDVIHYELGLIHFAQDEFDLAADHFESALRFNPGLIDAHRSLNELYWQQEDAKFLDSYRRAIDQMPGFAPLYHNLAAAYISSGDNERATAVLREALDHVGRNPYLVHGLAAQELKQGRTDIAAGLLSEALEQAPDNVRFLNEFANLHIRTGEYRQAALFIAQALEIEPNNQEVWAYQGLVWRLTDDERQHWLNDYDRLLKAYELPAPAGFASLHAFMNDLGTYLAGLHTARRQPLDQSVRNGTQTLGMLFKNTNPLVASLKSAVEACLQDYLASVPRDENHPFDSRLGQSSRFTGSWCVKLGSGGYHTNHVHPHGWLSCCNYISLPPLGDDSEEDRSGWIRFGQTSLQLGEREVVARAIKPEVGKCVFFPSYFWHGTYPFDSDQPRMTVPCDIDPV